MEFNQKALLDELLRLNCLAEPIFNRTRILNNLDKLLTEASKHLEHETDVKVRVHELLQLFYGDWGFFCDDKNYFYSSNLLLDDILKSREGMPVSLGAIVLFLADGLNLPIYPVDFPNQLLLRVDIDKDVAFIDPWNGKYVDQDRLQQWLEGSLGFGHRLSLEHVKIADIEILNKRLAQMMKNALMRDGDNFAALQIINDCLQKDPKNPYEIRDRGMALANLDCLHAAIADFDYFIENCPEDPSALLLQFEMDKMRNACADHLVH